MPWRGASADYDDFGIGFGVSGNFGEYLHGVLTATEKTQLEEIFRNVWREEYAFFPGTGLFTEPRVFIHKPNVKGLIFNPSEEVVDLSEVTIE
jgi:peptide/nickel transport system substrate-binding protein/nickel transport system substrate-binding protein